MAIYRQASLVKVIAGVSLVIGISCCFYAFEMHVMYPKTLTQGKNSLFITPDYLNIHDLITPFHWSILTKGTFTPREYYRLQPQ